MVLLDNGKVLIASGRGSPDDYHKLCYLYDPVANTWSAPGSNSQSHNNGRGDNFVKLPNGKILISAGEALIAQGATNECEVYDPTTGAWSAAAVYPGGKRSHLSCALLPNG